MIKRQMSAIALGQIKPADGLAVPALIEALDDESEKVRLFVADALGEMGGFSKHAILELERMQADDADSGCRREAGEAIEKIAGD